METYTEYEKKVVKVFDATPQQSLGTEDNPEFKQSLHLMLQDVSTQEMFVVELTEEEVQKVINVRKKLTSKEMIDLATALRNREHPLQILIPTNAEKTSLSLDDVLKSRSLDKKKKNRRRNRSKNKKVE